jgi:uncharacterized protein
MIPREVKLPITENFFLFGARATGKSTLLKTSFALEEKAYVNLLDSRTERELSLQPENLRKWFDALSEKNTHVVIDEIQRVPKLLDVVHQIIEERKYPQKIIMTGSSARKLKSGGANLLAGRAFLRNLYPLTAHELGASFSLIDAMQFGTLPKLLDYNSPEEKIDYLFSYSSNYLKEEVWSEHLIKNLNPFRKFLEISSQMNGKIINFSKIGKDVGVDTKTVQNYFSILEDTLLGFFLEAYKPSLRKRISVSPKFYLFDVGVARTLAGFVSSTLEAQTSYFGEVFEQFVASEVHRRLSYNKRFWKLCYFKTATGLEVDLVIERPKSTTIFIEIKSKNISSEEDARTLNYLAPLFPDSLFFLFSLDERPKKFGIVKSLHWREGIEEILNLS